MRGTIQNINASSITIPKIHFELRIDNTGQEKIKTLGYSMEISLSGLSIGNIFKIYNDVFDSRGSHEFTEEFIIDPYLFNAIEKNRNGGDVTVDVRFEFMVVKENIETGNKIGLLRYYFNNQYVSINQTKLSQKDWAKMASDMGYLNYGIFEISYSSEVFKEDFSDIMTRLEKAQKMFSQGEYEETLTQCRMAFEALAPLVSKKTNNYEMIPALAHEVNMGCKEEVNELKSNKIESLRQKIRNSLHIGPHEGYRVTREDAEYLLTMCISTVRYYAILFNKISK